MRSKGEGAERVRNNREVKGNACVDHRIVAAVSRYDIRAAVCCCLLMLMLLLTAAAAAAAEAQQGPAAA